jgi:hypothetical protein
MLVFRRLVERGVDPDRAEGVARKVQRNYQRRLLRNRYQRPSA